MKAVTTFSPQGYKEYGKRCLESLIKFWPSEIIVYYEEKPDLEHEKLIYRPLSGINDYVQFMEMAKQVPGSDGQTPQGYNMNYNTQKYCAKSFAQMDVDDDYVFWVDADCEAFREIPRDFLIELLADKPYCFFGRDTYTETGFVGFNKTHPKYKFFHAQYRRVYMEGVLFSLIGWHDCYAIDFAMIGIAGNNLSPGGTGFDHVIATSRLGEYLDHKKGMRKTIGHSPEQRVKWW